MSDILIRGMEMPQNCICCDLSHEDGWCPAKQSFTDRYTFETCPLVPVPPHGRLGDLGRIERALHEWESVVWDRNALQMLRDCINLVKAAPTIIPASEELT